MPVLTKKKEEEEESNSKKCFSRSLGEKIRRMWEMRASFGDEETASGGVLASLYLKQEVL